MKENKIKTFLYIQTYRFCQYSIANKGVMALVPFTAQENHMLFI